jgi:hypothetical protein
MNSREITRKIRLEQWTQALKERAAAGETVKEFCRNKGISRNAFFYWQRKVRSAVGEQFIGVRGASGPPAPVFREVSLTETGRPENRRAAESFGRGEIRIEASGLRITADGEYPAENLAALLARLAAPC